MSLIKRLFSRPETDYRAAGRRWAEINRRKREAGCPCGQPATEVRYDPTNNGPVPVETWSCADHVGAVSWTHARADGPGQPAWARPTQCDDCPGLCARMSRIGEAKPFAWHCPRGPMPKESRA